MMRSPTVRPVFALLCALTISAASDPPSKASKQIPLFEDVTRQAGLIFQNVSGSLSKDYIIDTVGGGAGLIDYDNDGFLDIYLVNGIPSGSSGTGSETPHSQLFRNNGNGTFTDVTSKAAAGHVGLGMGVAVADYDNDGWPDLYVTAFGSNTLYHNNGNGTFTDVTANAGVAVGGWSTGAAWGDYDKDGLLDLYVARYVDFNRAEIPPKGGSRSCQYKGLPVMCGPRGLKGSTGVLFHNNGDGTFRNTTVQALGPNVPSYYAFTPLWADFDDDGWPDLYVANDGTPSLLYHNRGDGTFEETGVAAGCAYSSEGREQAGMGADFADYRHEGRLSIFKTNFSDDYNVLYHNAGDGMFEDATEQASIFNVSWKELGWATKFVDFDLDGWPDLFIVNGHVYPEVDQWNGDTGYKQHPQLLRNLGNGSFQEVTASAGPALLHKQSGRGAAFGDLDNDGDIDVVLNNLDGPATLLRCNSRPDAEWLTIKLRGTRSNRDGLGAKIRVRAGGIEQFQEVHQSGSFLSSNDPRANFGLGKSHKADQIQIQWPSGIVQTLRDVQSRQILTVVETESHAAPFKDVTSLPVKKRSLIQVQGE